MLPGLLFVLCVRAQTVEFNRDVRPILSDKCFACHGPGAAAGKTKLRLDTPSAVVVPGDPNKSPLFERITTDNRARRMPPAWAGHDKLTPAEIDTVRRWIESGAKWESHWSFIPPKRAPGCLL
jgi:mono/diheme cytochrome c family protein